MDPSGGDPGVFQYLWFQFRIQPLPDPGNDIRRNFILSERAQSLDQDGTLAKLE